MRLASDALHRIDRQCKLPALQEFLQSRFWIAQLALPGQLVEPLAEGVVDDLSRGIEACVEVDGAEYRFERIGEDGRAPVTAGLALAGAENQVFAQVEFGCDITQCAVLDQR